MKFFKILKKDKKSKARLGIIHTTHGDIHTPSFVPVGTKASVKSLSSEDIQKTNTQLFFVNTYHMYLRPGIGVIKKAGGLHAFMNYQGSIITDSGGFQAFSLARDERMKLIQLHDKHILFRSHIDGSIHEWTPEKSLQVQKILGSDIILPLDDCTEFPATYKRTQEAVERTTAWAKRSLAVHQSPISNLQSLYGIVQGGIYKDLRIQSAKAISRLKFVGYAIGGVAVGENKKQMRDVCDWVIPELSEETPKHLLGVGEIDDIFDIIEKGIDTFDCVMPTRLARMGVILIKNYELRITSCNKTNIKKHFQLDITKSKYAMDFGPLDTTCSCWVCKNYSRAYIHHLFITRELLAYRLATFHNVYFINALVEEIRKNIVKGTFVNLKRQWLGDRF